MMDSKRRKEKTKKKIKKKKNLYSQLRLKNIF